VTDINLLAATTQQAIGGFIAAALILGWIAYVVSQARRNPVEPGSEIELAPNRKPLPDDEEMEGARLDTVLKGAFALMAVVAVGLPVYWLREPGRQVGAERGFDKRSVERGRTLFLPSDSPEHGAHFGCATCHGDEGVGGSTTYTITDYLGRQRQVTWAAPALNDASLRFSAEELRSILVYGRANTPMPAWGIEGGGPLNSQQIDDLVNYIISLELDADEVIAANVEKYGTDGQKIFEGMCARCHTKGYAYGEPGVSGGGAFGPSLLGGATLRQFPELQSHIDFVTEGTEYAQPYGVRGVGGNEGGGMPGFGRMLSPEQIKAVVEYERGL
jgi:mono/diheme cytochrome c family protein